MDRSLPTALVSSAILKAWWREMKLVEFSEYIESRYSDAN
jgi:hypothetical protein